MLTPSELESLFGEAGSLVNQPRRPGAGRDQAGFVWNTPSQPVDLDREQQFALEAMHRQLAHELSGHLSRLLNQTVAIEFEAMKLVPGGEMTADRPPPVCWIELRFDRFSEPLWLAFDDTSLRPLLDRLLGGTGEALEAEHARPLTEIELRLVARVAEALVTAMQKTWQSILPLQGHVVRVSASAERPGESPGDMSTVRTDFVLEPGRDRGRVTLVVSQVDARQLIEHLGETASIAAVGAGADAGLVEVVSRPRQPHAGEAILLLTETRMSPGELQGLAVGDVILTEKPVSAGMTLRLPDGTERPATLGQSQGRKAVSISGDAAPQDLVDGTGTGPVLDGATGGR